MELRDKRKKGDESEDRFLATIGYWQKMRSKIHYFHTNCRFWINKMLRRVISTIKMSAIETVLFLS